MRTLHDDRNHARIMRDTTAKKRVQGVPPVAHFGDSPTAEDKSLCVENMRGVDTTML